MWMLREDVVCRERVYSCRVKALDNELESCDSS